MKMLIVAQIGGKRLQFDGQGYLIDDEGIRTEDIPSLMGEQQMPPEFPQAEYEKLATAGDISGASKVTAQHVQDVEAWNKTQPDVASDDALINLMIIYCELQEKDKKAFSVRRSITDLGIHVRSIIAGGKK